MTCQLCGGRYTWGSLFAIPVPAPTGEILVCDTCLNYAAADAWTRANPPAEQDPLPLT